MKFAALLIAVLAFPASALGAESWRSPEPLSQAGTANDTARIATNSPGVAALIWTEFANGRTPRFRIRCLHAPADSTWTPSEQLSGAGEVGSGAVGVDPQGRITAVSGRGGRRCSSATKAPGQPWTAAQPIPDGAAASPTCALLWWAIAMILSSVYLPGASYFFSWPLLFSLAAYLLMSDEPRQPMSWKRLVLLNACALPVIILVTPMIYFVFNALTLSFVAPVIALTALLLGLLVPQLSIMARPNRWLLPAATGLPGVIVIIVCAMAVGFSAEHPKLNSIFYGLNADTGRAVWASMEQRPDAWTQQFLSDNAKDGTLPEFFQSSSKGAFLQSAAPVAPLVAPEIKVFDDRVNGDVRTLRLRVTSPRQASVLAIYLDSTAEVLRATVNGKQVADNAIPASAGRRNQWNMRYYGVPAEGFELMAEIKTTQPLKIRVVDQSYELPQLPGQIFTPRPPDMIPDSTTFNNSTMVSKSFTF